ncbi:pentapeptide repeat-containing protein [Pseudanabaena mucicola]|uniref:Pentapeptide repeat-containing protein n=1 Tax=Pseudanabaena mucicola FACHB-723 TaxID=2692860 RepID=A0ABR7ZXF3_9CYAN|nr:pentapeptide repeat-containing protein [Pseudanabaena mucicola]MBD2187921.1 pentapeptide repeat-containing protein [Pseudanabaena mucicola FACHB-723]
MAFNNNTSPKGQGMNEPDPKKVMPDVANENPSADDNLDWLKSLDLSPPVQTYSSGKPIKSHQEDTTTSFDDIDWLIVSDLKSKIDDSKITGRANTSGTSSVSQPISPSSIYNNDEDNDDLNLDGLDLLSLSSFNNIDSLESLDFGDVEEFDIDQLQGNIDDTEIKIRELSQLLDNELDHDVNLDISPTSEVISREVNDNFINLDDWDNGESIAADLPQDLLEMPREEADDTFNNLDADLLLNANAALDEIDSDHHNNDEEFWSTESPSIDTKELHDSVDNVFANDWSQPDDYPIDDAMWDIPLSIDSSADLDLSTPLENKDFDPLSPESVVSDLTTNDMDWEHVAIANPLTSDIIPNDMDWDSDMLSDDMEWDKDKPTFLGSDVESASLDLDDVAQDPQSIPKPIPEKLASIETHNTPPILDNFEIDHDLNILDTSINDLDLSEWDEITSSKSSDSSETNQDLGSFLVDNFDLEQFDDSAFIAGNMLESSTSQITTGLNNLLNKDNELEAEKVAVSEIDSEIEKFDNSINLTHTLTQAPSDALLNDSYEVGIDDEILVNELLNDNTFIQPLASNSTTDIDTLLEKEQVVSNDIDGIDSEFSISPNEPTSTSSFDLDMGSDFLDDFELDDPSSHFDDFDEFIPSSLSTSLNPLNNLKTPNVSSFDLQKNAEAFQQANEPQINNPPPLPFIPPLPPKRESPKQSAPQAVKPSPMAMPPALPRNAPLPPKSMPIPMGVPPQSRNPMEAAIPQKPRPAGNAPKLRDSIPDLNSIGLEEHDDSNDWSELLDSTNLSDSITTIISSGKLDRTPEAPKWKDNIDAPIRPPVPPAVKQSPPQQQPIPKINNSLNNDQLAQVEFERIAASAYYSDDSRVEAKPTTAEKIKKFKTSVLPPLSLETIWQDYLKIPVIGLGVIGIVAIIFSLANEPIFNMGLRWGVFKNASGKNFSNADFSGANLENVDFSKANLVGAKMEKANLVSANLQDAKLDGVNFTDANLSRTRLINASVVRSEFKNAQMNLADLSGANLERSNLVTAKMEGANLTGTKIGTQGKENATKLSPTVLLAWQIVNQPKEGRNLSKQNLSGLNLNSANLRRANLSGARLNYTDMTRVDLSGANLSSSQVNGVNWNGAKLTGANVSGIVFDANKAPRTDNKTICPDRKNGPCKF